MTQQEYEHKKRECMREFKREYVNDNVTWEPASPYDIFSFAFDRAYALGKQENGFFGKQEDAESVIIGWVARDMDGRIFLYKNKPERGNNIQYCNSNEWVSGNVMTKLRVDSFPDLTWESDPIEVELIIKRKKK